MGGWNVFSCFVFFNKQLHLNVALLPILILASCWGKLTFSECKDDHTHRVCRFWSLLGLLIVACGRWLFLIYSLINCLAYIFTCLFIMFMLYFLHIYMHFLCFLAVLFIYLYATRLIVCLLSYPIICSCVRLNRPLIRILTSSTDFGFILYHSCHMI